MIRPSGNSLRKGVSFSRAHYIAAFLFSRNSVSSSMDSKVSFSIFSLPGKRFWAMIDAGNTINTIIKSEMGKLLIL
jgi:hypothetical protein